ncbi:MAG: hypothetical protein ABIQ89_01565 [Candidatus Saccharimonadales bacterium]
MRIRISLISLVVGLTIALGLFAPVAHAAFDPYEQACNSSGASTATACQQSNYNPVSGSGSILARATQLVAVFTGVASVIAIIIGGFQYVTSGGDSQKTAKAKSVILYAVIGLVVAVSAQTILVFVINKL